ncbi:hypothetical protein PA0480 [Candidatus Phytoplasma australiense]|uniref:Uncharacterized protein n=1 Tax=Phytoplasma australiense TaxID=59748 RepID=B1VA41_PHYAS|nr:hypothetical protein PA0480 [Candidatus Phytoplasma australiense]
MCFSLQLPTKSHRRVDLLIFSLSIIRRARKPSNKKTNFFQTHQPVLDNNLFLQLFPFSFFKKTNKITFLSTLA